MATATTPKTPRARLAAAAPQVQPLVKPSAKLADKGIVPPEAPASKTPVAEAAAAVGKALGKAARPAKAVKPAKAAKTGKPAKAEKTEKTQKLEKTAKADRAEKDKVEKSKKPKLVRDSFTIPKDEYAVLEALKARAVQAGAPAKKSELLRAGIAALAAMPEAAFVAALAAVPAIKTGRPAKA
ncbi:MAG TPA: hypothetical protein VFE82_07040 [Ramlibacter sp.]|jgi:hypothetical protein|uniref:hypothetical protein n=1 Tax=Ramlibacter sp. TaxID=1917967 RepID=UPI002D3AF0BE|nr:hypothetical protein [Ramlibacter sp.]HZY18220.1 hypothetical protein [Ramlibacter sp.]